MAMMASPNTLAARTSSVAARTTSAALLRVSARPSSRCRSDRRRTAFSTMMTAPSTISPKSIAPRLIRLPDRPNAFITITANSSESGMVVATTRPARRSPRSTSSTSDHQQRALEQVRAHRADGALHQQRSVVEGLDHVPAGSDGLQGLRDAP